MSRNTGLASDTRQSSSSSWANVWYAPQHTPWRSNTSATSDSVRAATHGAISAASASRARKRSPSW